MNIKRLLLIALFGLSTATVRPNMDNVIAEAKQAAAWQAGWNLDTTMATILTHTVPGVFVGALTGTSIGYLSGQLFDAVVNKSTINLVNTFLREHDINLPAGSIPTIIAIARLGAQVGSKWYWEKPLRNKIMNWLIAELKAKGVDFNEELTKTIARISAWVGNVSQVKVG